MLFHILQFIYQTIFVVVLLGTSLWRPVVGQSALHSFTVPADSVAIDSLLVRISRVSERVSYSGVQIRIVRHRGKALELRWQEYHWHPERTVVIFLAPEDLRNSTLVLKGDQVKYRRNRHVRKKFRYGAPKDLLKNGQIFKEIALLRRNYHVTVSPGPIFVDQTTISLNVTPRHPGRPALQALVDTQSGLLLQTKRLQDGFASDSLAEISQFLEISYEEPDTTIFTRAWSETKLIKKTRKAKIYSDLTKLMTSYKGEVLIPKKVPDGFTLLQIKSIQRKEKSFLHFLYGDGLTFISLFQSKEDGEPLHKKGDKRKRKKREKEREPSHEKGYLKKAEHHGPFVIIRGKQDNIAYNILGEIPRAELAEMAESLETMH
ncbi:MAG: hypothetical protein ACE5JB_00790 [bacterium]